LTLPERALPRVVIVTSKISPTQAAEKEATKAFLHMLMEETPRDPDQQLPAVDVTSLPTSRKTPHIETLSALSNTTKSKLTESAE
jgi:hypothetical protein